MKQKLKREKELIHLSNQVYDMNGQNETAPLNKLIKFYVKYEDELIGHKNTDGDPLIRLKMYLNRYYGF